MDAMLSPSVPSSWAAMKLWASARATNADLPLEARMQAASLESLLDSQLDIAKTCPIVAEGLWQSCARLAWLVAELERKG